MGPPSHLFSLSVIYACQHDCVCACGQLIWGTVGHIGASYKTGPTPASRSAPSTSTALSVLATGVDVALNLCVGGALADIAGKDISVSATSSAQGPLRLSSSLSASTR